jgi:hypothetical protein
MSNLNASQALVMLTLTVIALFFLASIFSWSLSEWNWFSKVIFWVPTIVIGIWTINDYFLKPNKEK